MSKKNEISGRDASILAFLAKLPKEDREREIKPFQESMSKPAIEVAHILAGIQDKLQEPPSRVAKIFAQELEENFKDNFESKPGRRH